MRGTEGVIEESFLALKAVSGNVRPPIGAGSYRDMMNEKGLGKWFRDPKLFSNLSPKLCNRGWHAFPLSRVEHWRTAGSGGFGKPNNIWIVELSGKANWDYEKVCAEYIRFVSKLAADEVNQLLGINFSTPLYYREDKYLWSKAKPTYERAAQALGIEGLVLCHFKHAERSNRYSPQLLRVRPVKVGAKKTA